MVLTILKIIVTGYETIAKPISPNSAGDKIGVRPFSSILAIWGTSNAAPICSNSSTVWGASIKGKFCDN